MLAPGRGEAVAGDQRERGYRCQREDMAGRCCLDLGEGAGGRGGRWEDGEGGERYSGDVVGYSLNDGLKEGKVNMRWKAHQGIKHRGDGGKVDYIP